MQIPDLVVHNSKVREHWKVLRIVDGWASAHRLPMGGGKKLAGSRVLIVEDSFLVAEQLIRLVQDEGAEVVGPAAISRMACVLIHGGLLREMSPVTLAS